MLLFIIQVFRTCLTPSPLVLPPSRSQLFKGCRFTSRWFSTWFSLYLSRSIRRTLTFLMFCYANPSFICSAKRINILYVQRGEPINFMFREAGPCLMLMLFRIMSSLSRKLILFLEALFISLTSRELNRFLEVLVPPLSSKS